MWLMLEMPGKAVGVEEEEDAMKVLQVTLLHPCCE